MDTELYAHTSTTTAVDGSSHTPSITELDMLSTLFTEELMVHVEHTNPVVYAIAGGASIAFLCVCLFTIRIYCKYALSKNEKAANMGLFPWCLSVDSLCPLKPIHITDDLTCGSSELLADDRK